MVSKLALGVSENFFAAIDSGADAATVSALRDHFREIRAGIGAEKSPTEYGAFASDAYSHTPENAGVKQPGMTGQVKEDILSRFAELGVHVENGSLGFRFDLFDRSELLTEAQDFTFCGLNGDSQTIVVPAGAMAFTLCQVPVICKTGPTEQVEIEFSDGRKESVDGLRLDEVITRKVFSRSGKVTAITCQF